MQRVSIYIDGFNLYFGLKSKKWQKYYWLDIYKVSKSLLKENQEISEIKYFSSKLSSPSEKAKRQHTYLEALETLEKVSLYFGKYQNLKRVCKNCGFIEFVPNEKMTDVNIANEMLADAFQDNYDIALLVSADSDLVPPIKNIKRLFSNKKIIVAFPPDRRSKELQQLADGFIFIGEDKLRKNQLPITLLNKNQYPISKPERWK